MRHLCILVALLGVTSSGIAEDLTSADNIDDIIERPLRYAIKEDSNRRFPNGIVPYSFNDGFTDLQMEQIKEQMSVLENYTKSGDTFCIKFRPRRDTDIVYLDIRLHSLECHSQLGANTDGGATKLYLARSCIPKNVVHELMHVLGFTYEHTREDRDSYIDVDYDAIKRNNPSKQIFDYYIQDGFTNQSIPYDYGSELHYGPSIGFLPKGDNYIGGRRLLLGMEMSEYDVLRIQRYYSCAEDNTEYKKAIPQLFVNCSFEDDLCNLEMGSLRRPGQSSNWTRTKAPEGQASNRGYYLVAKANDPTGRMAVMRTPIMEPGCYRFAWAYNRSSIRDGNYLRLLGYEHVGEYIFIKFLKWHTRLSGNFWEVGVHTENFTTPWHLQVDGGIGVNSATDIAIDDLVVAACL